MNDHLDDPTLHAARRRYVAEALADADSDGTLGEPRLDGALLGVARRATSLTLAAYDATRCAAAGGTPGGPASARPLVISSARMSPAAAAAAVPGIPDLANDLMRAAFVAIAAEGREPRFFDGFNDALIGTARAPEGMTVPVYDRGRILEILLRDVDAGDEDPEATAEEYFSYNVEGAYFGPDTPFIVERPARSLLELIREEMSFDAPLSKAA